MSRPDLIDFKSIRRRATEEFILGPDSFHGPAHWRRVEVNGLWLSEQTRADTAVVRLFAALHDACRWDEGTDPEHGRRSAVFARRLWNEVFELEYERFAVLEYAIAYHADGKRSDDPTIGTCWDADRLDLPRVGIWPEPELLCTEAAREKLRDLESQPVGTDRNTLTV
jgi:uncharacterized protein